MWFFIIILLVIVAILIEIVAILIEYIVPIIVSLLFIFVFYLIVRAVNKRDRMKIERDRLEKVEIDRLQKLKLKLEEERLEKELEQRLKELKDDIKDKLPKVMEESEHFPLDVEFKLNPTEQCYLFADNVSWYLNKEEEVKKIISGAFYITNKRIMIISSSKTKKILISSILKFDSEENILNIWIDNGSCISFLFDCFEYDEVSYHVEMFQNIIKIEYFLDIFLYKQTFLEAIRY